jgi:two-component system, cell cycle sensor histidine kinase and response regulator CckA
VVNQAVNDLRYRFLVENTTDYAIFTMDLDGRVETWNAGAERLLGYTSEEMIGHPASEVFSAGEAAGTFANEMREAKATGRADDEGWLQRKDGSRLWASGLLLLVRDEVGAPMGLAKIVRDATERRGIEVALEASELRFRTLVEQSPMSTLIAGRDGHVVQVNPAWMDLWGYTLAESQALPGFENAEAQLSTLAPHIERALAGERVVPQPAEFTPSRGRHAGQPLWVSTYLYPVRDSVGIVREVVVVQEDVTERKRVEDALRHTQKMESLGLLAGGIAHDFNNILTTILANASLALQLSPTERGPRTTALLQDVVRGGLRAADLAGQLLTYAGKGQTLFAPLHLNDVVSETADLLRASVGKKVTLGFDLDPALPPVQGDRSQLQQLVMNLVLNGVEAHGAETGSVLVRTAHVHSSAADLRQRSGTGVLPDALVQLEVIDTGSGMSVATQTRIFDPFFTTKFTGRGLGLAAVQGIVRSHGGVLELQSGVGQGSTFRVLLPALPPVTLGMPLVVDPGDLSGSGLVLLVDDEAPVRAAAAQTLEQYGYKVVEARNGAEGLHQLTNTVDGFCLVILDMTMPVMDGEQVVAELRRRGSQVPILAVSGYGETVAVQRLVGRGVAGFLRKPFTAEGLATAVKETLT